MKNAEQLANVSIAEVAGIAAHLPPETPPMDAIMRAYELLEWAAAGKTGLHYKSSYRKGLESQRQYEEQLARLSANPIRMIPEHIIPLEEDGETYRKDALIPFEVALTQIIPKPGQAKNRLPFFRKWVMAYYKITSIEAGTKIAEWKAQGGLPAEVFIMAFYQWPKWRKQQTSENNKAASAASREAKKLKQGRVISKTDKRKGARPPVEKFKKAIGAS